LADTRGTLLEQTAIAEHDKMDIRPARLRRLRERLHSQLRTDAGGLAGRDCNLERARVHGGMPCLYVEVVDTGGRAQFEAFGMVS
jgi:hypothetical protein